MNVLMHTCCAPCSIMCIDSLRQENIEPISFWFNPNIHPFTEYRSRRNTLVEYAKSVDMRLILQGDYGLRSFLAAVDPPYDQRCDYCYRVRLDTTAAYAAENGYSHFTSTLFISPYQDHQLMKQTAEEAAEKYNIGFLYRDFRPLFRQGQDRARELGLYMQKYCGCIFSEEDRYRKKKPKKAPV